MLNKRNQKKMYIVQNSIFITFQKMQIIVTEIKLVVSWEWEQRDGGLQRAQGNFEK